MTEIAASIDALMQGTKHFGEIPEADQRQIIVTAREEVAYARQNNAPVNPNSASKISFDELSGPATQAFIVGNLGLVRYGVSKAIKVRLRGQTAFGIDDTVNSVVVRVGAFLTAYDPDISGKHSGYFTQRVISEAKRSTQPATLTLTACVREIIRIYSFLDNRKALSLEPLTTDDFEAATKFLPIKLREDLLKDEQIERVKRMYGAFMVSQMVLEAEAMDEEVVYEHYIDVLFDNADELVVDHDEVADPASEDFTNEVAESVSSMEASKNLNWDRLTSRSRLIVELFFGIGQEKPLSMKDIGVSLGMTRQNVHIIISKSLKTLISTEEPTRAEKATIIKDRFDASVCVRQSEDPDYSPIGSIEAVQLINELRKLGYSREYVRNLASKYGVTRKALKGKAVA